MALAVQADGKILVGGDFTTLGGGGTGTTPRNYIGRLSNSDPAWQNLTVDSSGSTITWNRSGTAPEVNRVICELSQDGTTYAFLGSATRVSGGWELTGLSLPQAQSLFIRARGFYSSGVYDASGSIVESVRAVFLQPLPCYALSTAANPAAGGTVTVHTASNCTGGYTSGSAISLTAAPATSYAFSGWTGSGGTFADIAATSTTFTINGDATVTANFTLATPGAAVLLSPNGGISTSTPTYTWNAVASATWYRLWVNDASASPKIEQWYTAQQAGCASGTGTCSVTPSTPMAQGAAQWWIQTWNAYGYGPWSDGMTFVVGEPPEAASEILPFGTTGNKPNFIWSEVSSASWYYLWVNGPAGTPVIQQWYTAAQAKCGGGDCAVPAATTLADGAYTWWVQTWNSSGLGPWSAGMTYNVSGCQPGSTVLIQPSGSASNPPPWYWWYDVGNTSWYYLWVNGPSGVPVIQQWYTAAQANCDGKWCWVTNATTLPAGTSTWWVETWNTCGYGPWSAGGSFTVPSTIIAAPTNPKR